MIHTFFCLPTHGQEADPSFEREIEALAALELPASLLSVEEVALDLLEDDAL